MKVLSWTKSTDDTCRIKISQEGIQTIAKYTPSRIIEITHKDLLIILPGEGNIRIADFTEELQEKLKGFAKGSFIGRYTAE